MLHFAVEKTEEHQVITAQYEWLPNVIVSVLMTTIFFWILKKIQRS